MPLQFYLGNIWKKNINPLFFCVYRTRSGKDSRFAQRRGRREQRVRQHPVLSRGQLRGAWPGTQQGATREGSVKHMIGRVRRGFRLTLVLGVRVDSRHNLHLPRKTSCQTLSGTGDTNSTVIEECRLEAIAREIRRPRVSRRAGSGGPSHQHSSDKRDLQPLARHSARRLVRSRPRCRPNPNNVATRGSLMSVRAASTMNQ